jgi:SET and MYND domain-containing protein
MFLAWRALSSQARLDAIATLRPSPNFETAAVQEKCAAWAAMLREFLRDGDSTAAAVAIERIPVLEVMLLLSKLELNAFTISDFDTRPVGIGVFPRAALINHSCAPNATASFEANTAYVRALRRIAPGEEVTVSYIDIGEPCAKRRAELRVSFGFDCRCERCMAGDPKALMALRCCDPSCAGCVSREEEESTACDTCGRKRNQDQDQDSLAMFSVLFERAKALSSEGKRADAIQVLERAIAVGGSVLHPLNFELFDARNKLMNWLIDASDYRAAKRICKASIPAYQLAYPPGSVGIGLQYAMLGKLFWYLGKTGLALVWLRKAMPVLGLSYGEESQRFCALRELLHQVEVEAGADPRARHLVAP